MKKVCLYLLFICSTFNVISKTDSLPSKRKIKPYFMWGYNREVYTTSTIHFVNHGTGVNENGPYDFKVMDVKAHDRPDFDQMGDVINITIPQYNARIGFWLNNGRDEGFELNFDHAKYVVTNYQTARFVGNINGMAVDKDSILDPSYFHFEHTDGVNMLMTNYMRRFNLYTSKDANFKIGYVIKPGIGIVIPRTDVTIFGQRLNNDFKIAGISAGFATTIRCEIVKHIVLEFSGKAGWINFMNALVHGKGNGKASHKVGFLEGIFCFGYQL